MRPSSLLEPLQTYRLSAHRHRGDFRLVLVMALLLLIGLIVIYAISPALSYRLFAEYRERHFLYRQLINISLGIIAFVVASTIPLERWRQYTKGIVYGSLAANALLLVPGLGVNVKGATRWLNVGLLSSFQPSETLKLALILLLADRLSRLNDQQLNDTSETLKPALWILVVSGAIVVLLQKDMGTMLVITGIICAMIYLAGVSWNILSKLLGVILAAGVGAIALFPYRLQRLMTFLRPDDAQGSGYHVAQSLISVGSGGIFGLGLGKSLQVYGYQPEAASDSIFAIFAEKFGFVGTITLLVLFGILIQRLISIAMRAPDRYTQLLTGGILVWLASHVLINVGAMLALLPLTGITLPFLSVGGSSLLLIMFSLGLVFQISHYTGYRVSDPVLPNLNMRVRAR